MPCFRGRRGAHSAIGGDLRHAGAGDDAGGADRAGTDADLDRVGAGARSAALVASAVATLPATSGHVGVGSSCAASPRPRGRRSLWPCEVSRHEDVDLGVDQRAARARAGRRPTPTAAPTRRRPSSSLQALGYSMRLLDVLDRDQALEVARRRRPPAASRCGACAGCALASSRVVPTGTVTRLSLVMASRTGDVRVGFRSAGRGW